MADDGQQEFWSIYQVGTPPTSSSFSSSSLELPMCRTMMNTIENCLIVADHEWPVTVYRHDNLQWMNHTTTAGDFELQYRQVAHMAGWKRWCRKLAPVNERRNSYGTDGSLGTDTSPQMDMPCINHGSLLVVDELWWTQRGGKQEYIDSWTSDQ